MGGSQPLIVYEEGLDLALLEIDAVLEGRCVDDLRKSVKMPRLSSGHL